MFSRLQVTFGQLVEASGSQKWWPGAWLAGLMDWLTYDMVSDKGWKLGARRHKINYNFFSIGDPPKNYGSRVYNKFS